MLQAIYISYIGELMKIACSIYKNNLPFTIKIAYTLELIMISICAISCK
jgi:hypothetical protein